MIRMNYKPTYKQEIFHDSKARFRVVCAGRRYGKSISACAEAFKLSVMKPKQRTWVIAPTFKLSEENFRILKEISPIVAIKEIKLADRKIVLLNESEIELKSAENEGSLRGASLDLAILDECSRIKPESWHAIRPSLADRMGRGIFVSTPRGKNWFYELFMRGQDPNEKDWESWRFSSKDSPYFSIEEYHELKKSLPADVASQELDAIFIDDASAVFRGIKDRIKGSLEGPHPGQQYSMGIDLAKFSDFTAICILNQNRHLVYFDRFQKLDWGIQKERILMLAKRYNNANVLIDSTGLGSPILDDLQTVNKGKFWGSKDYIKIEGYKFTSQSKNQLIQALQMALETESISYPDIPIMISEMESFGYEILPSGTFRFEAMTGHDDAVVALALANWNFEYIKPVWHGPSRTLDISFRPGAR
jgi:hypothetical protein